MGYNDIDNLIKMKSDKLPWHDEDEDTYYEAIDHVSKRFNFKSEEKKPENKTPKRQILPFYSHKGDVFEDTDNNPFIEDATEEELEIGILSNIQKKNNDKICTFTSTSQDSAFRQFYSDALNTASKYVEPKYTIQINRSKDNMGNSKICFVVSVFTESFTNAMRRSNSLNMYVENKSIDEGYFQHYIAMTRQFNKYLKFLNMKITDIISKTINAIFNSPDDELPDYVKNIRFIYVSGHNLPVSVFNRHYSDAQNDIFKFSEYIIKETMKMYDSQYIINIANDMVFSIDKSYKDGFLTFVNEFTELVCDKLCKDWSSLPWKTYNEVVRQEVKDLLDINLMSTVPKRKRTTKKPSWE